MLFEAVQGCSRGVHVDEDLALLNGGSVSWHLAIELLKLLDELDLLI